jgi:hypothetical protein
MAIYHVMAVPKAGEDPPPAARPLAPRDISADSDQHALERTASLIAEEVGEFYESILQTQGDEAADAFYAAMQRWQPMARRVERPHIDVKPRSWITDALHDGKVVGQHFNYGEDTGEQMFDVFVDGAVCGCLVEGRRRSLTLTGDGQRHEIRVWMLREAAGALAPLAGHVWEDHDRPSQVKGFAWPDAALAGIRAELEAKD